MRNARKNHISPGVYIEEIDLIKTINNKKNISEIINLSNNTTIDEDPLLNEMLDYFIDRDFNNDFDFIF